MVSAEIPGLDALLKDGYPGRSAVLMVGPPGIGKQALGYWFTHSGLAQGDSCLYITRLPVGELKPYEQGLRVLPLLRVRKMKGMPPQSGCFNFTFTRNVKQVSAHGK